eukprot:8118887-Alexandrium_andersonii.AAC.1
MSTLGRQRRQAQVRRPPNVLHPPASCSARPRRAEDGRGRKSRPDGQIHGSSSPRPAQVLRPHR